MKNWKLIVLACIGLLLTSFVAIAKENVEGFWFNQEKDAKIEIYKATDGKYYGKIVWLKNPNDDKGVPKTDFRNPKANLAKRPLMGLSLLKGFVKDSDKVYDDGEIYDPKSGKTYSCTITVKDANTLSIRGYIGISMIGKTTIWTRTTN